MDGILQAPGEENGADRPARLSVSRMALSKSARATKVAATGHKARPSAGSLGQNEPAKAGFVRIVAAVSNRRTRTGYS